MTQFTCILLGVFLMTSVVCTAARECYHCKFVGCGDEFSRHALGVMTSTCSGTCFKSKWGQQITRGCSDSMESDGCRDEDISGNKGRVCYCNSDLCNTGTDVRSASVISLVFLSATVLCFHNF